MDKRTVYLAIAVLLTILDCFVMVWYALPALIKFSGDTLFRGLMGALVVLEAASLVNVWAQMFSRSRCEFEKRSRSSEFCEDALHGERNV